MKNIIITGASRGIGLETAKFLIEKGHNILAISRNEEKLSALKAELGDRFNYLFSDFSEADFCNTLTTEIIKLMPSIDGLINNSGALISKPFNELTHSDIQSVYQVNVFAPMLLTQALLPYFSDNAHVVNISSMGGFQGSMKFAGLSAYSSSKAAIASFTECFAEEHKETNIAMNCLTIGAAQTEMLKEAFPGYEAPLSAKDMGEYVADFLLTGHKWFKGKILPVSVSTP